MEVTEVNNELTYPSFVAALPSAEAAIVHQNQVLKIDSQGQTVEVLYECDSCFIFGLTLLGSNLYAIQRNGIIVKIGTNNIVYTIPDVERIKQYGSQWSYPSEIPNTDTLLLCDNNKGEVFSYNVSSEHKKVLMTGFEGPTSVSCSISDNKIVYLVCDQKSNLIKVYDSLWVLVSSFGNAGSGEMHYPWAAIMSPNNTIIASHNGYPFEFSINGEFLREIRIEGLSFPTSAMSYSEPYLWVAHSAGLRRYDMSV